jgi:hypothetical protein
MPQYRLTVNRAATVAEFHASDDEAAEISASQLVEQHSRDEGTTGEYQLYRQATDDSCQDPAMPTGGIGVAGSPNAPRWAATRPTAVATTATDSAIFRPTVLPARTTASFRRS